jgi:hypothetical protein
MFRILLRDVIQSATCYIRIKADRPSKGQLDFSESLLRGAPAQTSVNDIPDVSAGFFCASI